ncbi:right-handed parallel beta-helix repeat-containing protein [Kitasatospora sp. NPDC101155]|uniref:right-handed parallel beta-helix repeat-containing protein n=1 Tax=Kitasatospora sp. NPDC101155 TaxID=3364097 RepID=UPI003829DB64
MRTKRLAAIAALALSVTGVLPLAGTAQATVTDLYVNNGSGAGCSDTAPGAGSQAVPFCTISAAADIVQAGQTVHVTSNIYKESVHLTHSGTPGAPITFTGPAHPDTTWSPDFLTSDYIFNLDHVHDVVLEHMSGQSAREGVVVTGSSRVTLDSLTLQQTGDMGYATTPALHITGGSSAVTVRRSHINSPHGEGLVVDGGSSGVVITTNFVGGTVGHGVLVSDAPGTVITSNTTHNDCGPGIELAGSSSGATVENNILAESDSSAVGPWGPCPAGTAAHADLVVSAASATGTTADYNLITTGTQHPYTWAGQQYADVPSFQQGSGQGAHDLSSDIAKLNKEGSPAIDSADANAPGELPTDIDGNPRVDDPLVTNTGTGVGYYDRGAQEYQGGISPDLTVAQTALQAGQPDTPLHVTATSTGVVSAWPVAKNTIDFGDGTMVDTVLGAAGNPHDYAAPGTYTVTDSVTNTSGGSGSTSRTVTVGSDFSPLAPARILDTRSGTGAPAQQVGPGGVLKLQVTGHGGVPADGKVTAVLLNLTATGATAATHITAFQGGQVPTASNLNAVPGLDVGNAAVVPVAADGTVSLYNHVGNVDLIADVQGFYSTAPQGTALRLDRQATPVRTLDTRDSSYGIGMVGSGQSIRVPVRGTNLLPADAQYAMLNLTATEGTANSYITAAPDGNPPSTSNLNFTAGQTVANQVTAPINADGTVTLYNHTGNVHLIVDIQGGYRTAGGASLVTTAPTRVLDTRDGTGGVNGKIGPSSARWVKVAGVSGIPLGATAVLINLTATDPTADSWIAAGNLTGANPTPSFSNLNMTAGATVPNLALVPVDKWNGTIVVYNHAGSTDLVADVQGYTM